jgi:hypothetical protein
MIGLLQERAGPASRPTSSRSVAADLRISNVVDVPNVVWPDHEAIYD